MLRIAILSLLPLGLLAQSIAFTFDDGPKADRVRMTAAERNAALLGHLKEVGVRSALFFTARKGPPEALELVRAWGEAGHLIGNHTATHPSFHSTSLEAYAREVRDCDALIRTLPGYTKRFRFTYLKEGDTAAKRDGFRRFLKRIGYGPAPVSVDASDWYYNARLQARLEKDPAADLEPYRKAYLAHLWDRACYYDGLSRAVAGRSVKHVLLLHHNLVNALFLGDVLRLFRAKGWTIVPPAEAFADPIYAREPRILPAGESLLWALAREKGLQGLRYPGEDDAYEAPILDQLGL